MPSFFRRSLQSPSAPRARLAATRGVWTLLAALAAFEPQAAGAQAAEPSAEVQTEARRLFDEGRAHATAERWPAAVTSFEGSRALLERPSTLFNLASALVRVGRSIEALEAVEVLERIADPERDQAMLVGVTDLRARARSSLRHVVLTIVPESAALEVDGDPVAGTGARRELTLDPGAHSASVSLAGFVPQRVEIALGEDTLSVSLVARLARVRVEPSVPGALVRIDGELRGTGAIDVELSSGAHQLDVIADGHEPLARRFEVEPGAELTVAAELVPISVLEQGVDVPLVVGLTVGSVALVAGVATVLGVIFGTTTVPPSGGSTGTVVAVPLTGPTVLRF